MIDETRRIPQDQPIYEVRVIALKKSEDPASFRYLQAKSMGTFGASLETMAVAELYHKNVNQYAQQLAECLTFPIDAVLSPPSSNPNLAEPYKTAVILHKQINVDLSSKIKRADGFKVSNGTSCKELVESYTTDLDDIDLHGLNCIAIVDEIHHTGITAAALISVLKREGLPDNCKILIACPWWSTGKCM